MRGAGLLVAVVAIAAVAQTAVSVGPAVPDPGVVVPADPSTEEPTEPPSGLRSCAGLEIQPCIDGLHERADRTLDGLQRTTDVCDLAVCLADSPPDRPDGGDAEVRGASEGPGSNAHLPVRDRAGLTVLVTVAAASLYAGGFSGSTPLVRLYRRMDRDDVLGHPLRKRALRLLEDRPGLTAGDVADRLDATYDNARYHLEILDEFDEVHRRRLDCKVRFFPNHRHWSDRAARRVATLAEPRRRTILAHLLETPGATTSQVAETVGVAVPTATFHLERLADVGLVVRERDGMAVRNRVDDQALASLPAMPGDPDQ